MKNFKSPLFIPSPFYQQFLKSGGVIKAEGGLYTKWLLNHPIGSWFHKLFKTEVDPAEAYSYIPTDKAGINMGFEGWITPEVSEFLNDENGNMTKNVGTLRYKRMDGDPQSRVTVIRDVHGPYNQYSRGQLMQIVNGPDTVYYTTKRKMGDNKVRGGIANSVYKFKDDKIERYPNNRDRQAFDAVDSLFKAKNAMFNQ